MAAYNRVSTLMDQDSEQQLILIREFAKARYFDLVHEYTDRGISGVREKRSGLDALVVDARTGRFNIIIVSSPR